MNPQKLPLRLAKRLRKPEGSDPAAWVKGALVVPPSDEVQAQGVPQAPDKSEGEVWADDGSRGRDGAVVLADAMDRVGTAGGDAGAQVATDAPASGWTLAQADAATSERLGAAAQACEPQRQNDEQCDDRGGLFWWLKGSAAFVPVGLGFGLGAGLLAATSGGKAGSTLLDVALGAGPFKSGVFVIQIFDQHGLLFTLSWDDAGHVRTQSNLAQASDVQVHTSTTVDGHTVVTGLSLNFGAQTGPVMAVLYDPDTTDGKPIEYFDEVAGVIALDSSLRAMTTLHEGNNYMAITPFTELATRLALGQPHSAANDYAALLRSPQEVHDLEAANKTVSDWLGVNVVSDLPTAVNDVAYAAQTSSAAKSYGDALAALSRLVPGTLLGGVEKLLSTAASSSSSAADVSALLRQALTDYHNDVSGVTPLVVSLDAAVTAKTLLNASDVAQLHISGSSLNAPEGSLVQVVLTDASGQVHALQAQVDAQGHWSVAMPTGLPDGAFQLSSYIDAQRPAGLALMLDSTAPTAPLDGPIMLPGSDTGLSDHDGITRDARPVFAVASLPADAAAMELLVDGVVVAATYDSQTHTLQPDAALGDGRHQISYRYVDAAGNASATSSSQSFVLDSTAPGAPSAAPVMLASSDTGPSDHDGITHDARPVFTVASLPADATTLELLVDGVVVTATYDSQTQTLRPDVALNDGPHQISYRYVDAAGNASAASSGVSVIIDSAVPSLSVSGLQLGQDTGASSTDWVTQVASPQMISCTLGGPLANGEKLYGSLDGGATWIDITASVSGMQLSWAGVTLPAGPGSVTMKIVDAAGNESEPISQSFELDTVSPTHSVFGLLLSQDTGESSTDWVTQVAGPQTISGILGSPLASDESLFSSLDGGVTWVDISASVIGTELMWQGVNLSGATGSVQFKVMDAAGNAGPVSSHSYAVDTTTPSLSVSGLQLSQDTGTSSTDWVTQVASPQTISCILGGPLTSGEKLYGSLDGGATWMDISASVSGTQLSWSGVSFPAGQGTVTFKVVDVAGNESQTSSQSYVLDTVSPNLIVTGLELNQDTGVSNTDWVTQVASPQTISGVLGIALSSDEILYASLDGGATWIDISASVSGTQLSWSGVTLPAGQGTVTFKVVDAAGNESQTSSQSYVLDTTSPNLSVSGLQLDQDTGVSSSDWITHVANPQTISGNLGDPLASGETLYGSVDGGATWIDISASVSGMQLSWSDVTLPSRSGSVMLKVVDAAGNESQHSSRSFVLDSTAPMAPPGAPVMLNSSDTGPSDHDGITQNARPVLTVASLPSDATGLQLVVDGVVVNATYDGLAHTLRPDMALGDGLHQIAYRYVDAAGNVGQVGPSLGVDIDATEPHGSAITGVSISTLSGTYETGCILALSIAGVPVTGTITLHSNGTWSYMPSPAELHYLANHNATEIKLVVTDAAGNEAPSSHTVTASDFEAPHIREFIPFDSGVLANDANGQATLNVVFSKAVYAGTGDIKVYDFSNQLVATVPVSGPGVSIEGDGLNDVYVTLPGLTIGTHYYVTFDAGTFVDANNQAFAGQLQTGLSGWDFTAVTASIAPDFVAADDMINAAERRAPVEIGGRVVSDRAVLSAITSADLSVDVRDANNQPVAATVTGYDPASGAFTFELQANVWSEGTYRYTVSLAGSSGAALGVLASYHFNNLVVDLTPPSMTASLQSAQDDVGSRTGELWAGTTVLASSDDSSPFLSGTLSAALSGDARVVVYRQDVTDPNQLGAMQRITGVEGLQPTGLVWEVSDSGLQNGHVYQYTACVEDAAGNRSATTVGKSIAVDMTAPSTRISALQLLRDSGSSNSDWVTNVAGQWISGALSNPLGAGEKLWGSLDGGLTWTDISVSVTTTAVSSGSSVVTNTVLMWRGVTLQQGQSTVMFKVMDDAGNAGPIASQAYTLDTTAPSAPTVNPVALDADAAIVLAGTATLAAGEQLTVTVNGASYTVTPANGVWSLNLGTATRVSGTLGQFVAGQNYEVLVTAKDAAGNTSTDGTRTELHINAPAFTGVSLSAIAAGSGGFAINDLNGMSVSGAGDVNGDGLEDLIVGSPNATLGGFGSVGRSYVVFGKTSNMAIDLSTVAAGVGGFVINGQCQLDCSGGAVSGAGDVNGDGLADLIVGGSRLNGLEGRGFVVFGKSSGTAVDLSVVAGGSGGFIINGASFDNLGSSVSGAGDVNGDGLADLIIGAENVNIAGRTAVGRTYVVFGKSTGTAVNLLNLTAGYSADGFVINGQQNAERSGSSVSGAGDVNGDGLADLIVGGAYASTSTMVTAGRSYVVFGKTDSFPVDVAGVVEEQGGFVINGASGADLSGISVAGAGDVNGDGLADLIVGACFSDTAAGADVGRSYVVFGKANNTAIELTAVAAGTGGFAINGLCAGDFTGERVSSAGDINGDGLADLIVGVRNSDLAPGVNAGRSYVVFGKSTGTAIDLSAVDAGSGGFAIAGQSSGDQSGSGVSAAGDVNGDGLADLIVGAPMSLTASGYIGRSYVIFGSTSGAFSQTAVDWLGTSGDDTYAATALGQSLAAGAGNDTLTANGATVLQGGAGNDTFVLDSGMLTALAINGLSNGVLARVDGGSGTDTISLGGSGLVLDLTQVANQAASATEVGSRIGSVERIDLTGTGNNTLTLTPADILDMAGMNLFNNGNGWTGLGASVARHQLVVDGNAGDVLNASGEWRLGALVTSGGQIYQAYDSASMAAQLLVDVDITSNILVRMPYVPIALSAIAAGVGGFAISGKATMNQIGYSVSGAGDVNGDGLADLIVGGFAGGTPGQSYVVFGKSTGTGIDVSAVAAGSGGFVINGQCAYDIAGTSVSEAGDVNGDGLGDLIVGAPYSGVAGRSYVVFGQSAGTPINLSDVAAGAGGFAITGQTTGDQSGFCVSGAGDVNGDGLADLIVGAPYNNATGGRSYVVFGQTVGTAVNLSAVAAGSGGFVINGQAAGDQTGYSVSGAGDVNGDGLADLIVGAHFGDPAAGTNAGRSYVVWGKSTGSAINLATVAAGTGGFVLNGQVAGDFSGIAVSGAGDVNGDGLADLLVGASYADPVTGTNGGRSYVVFGKSTGTAINLAAVAAGTGGFVINGQCAGDYSGMSLSNAGDVNGDGLADVIVSAYSSSLAAGVNVGSSYLVYGKSSSAAIDLSAVAAGSGGFLIYGQNANDTTGYSVASAGDVNGDGLADLVVGAPGVDLASGTNAGQSYVIFGGTTGTFIQSAVDWLGTSGDDTRAATAAGQTLVGAAGNDTLSANGATVLQGGAGDDTFVLDSGMRTALATNGLSSGVLARVDGGSGLDTIKLSGTGLTLDLTLIANQAGGDLEGGSRISSVEYIDLTGAGNNTLKLMSRDVLDMSGFNLFATTSRHQLLVKADTGDVIDLADATGTTGWTHAADTMIAGLAYQTWNHNSVLATVYVSQTGTVI